MKTSQEIAADTIGHWLTDIADERSVKEMVTQAIEADREQLAGAIEKLLDETKPPRVFDEEDWERQGNNGAIQAVLAIIRGESE